MPISQRRQRARVYRYSPSSVDGWVKRGYTFVMEYWARLEERDVSSSNAVSGINTQQTTHVRRASIEFHGSADVRDDDVVKMVGGGVYRVESAQKKVQTNELVVAATATDMDQLTLVDP